MATDLKFSPPVSTEISVSPTYPPFALRVVCWAVTLSLGAAQAWASRFTMNPDGISYLDIGDAYWRGDWHNAINAYWSPLYSWILGLFLKVVKPSPYWEYPLVHLVNFLVFAATVASFEFFLSSFVAQQQSRNRELHHQGEMGLSPTLWHLLGYAVFISTSLAMVARPWVVSPDMLVFLFTCLDCALLVRIRCDPTRRNFLLLGVALGLGYLSKAVLFPLGFIFLIIAVLSARAYRQGLVSLAVFLAIAMPFIAAISYSKHRLTFGDSGRLTYAGYISNLEPWFPGDGGDLDPAGIGFAENIDSPSKFSDQLIHPAKRIFDNPATYFFGGPIGGTDPFWYDVSYWQDGIRPKFDLSRQLLVIRYALANFVVLIGGIFHQLVVTVALLLLFVLAPRPSVCFASVTKSWYLVVPMIVGILMYSIVHFEYRYVAPFVCIGWIALFSGVRLPVSNGLRHIMRFVVSIVFCSQIAIVSANISNDLSNKDFKDNTYSEAAEALRKEGIAPGTKIVMISDEPLGKGGPFVARLARLQIVAQVNTPAEFWSAPLPIQSELLGTFAVAKADAALSWRPKGQASQGWNRLGNTAYFMRRLQ